ncbi:MAG: EMC3/TMCO1 family protein, partial [Halobacteriaceae archaeon]
TLVLPFVGQVGLQEGAVGPMQTWIVWYFLCSMGFSQVIRKALDIQVSPT